MSILPAEEVSVKPDFAVPTIADLAAQYHGPDPWASIDREELDALLDEAGEVLPDEAYATFKRRVRQVTDIKRAKDILREFTGGGNGNGRATRKRRSRRTEPYVQERLADWPVGHAVYRPQKFGHWLVHYTKAPAVQRHSWLAYDSHDGRNGIFAGNERIASMVGITTRTLEKHLELMQDAKLLRRHGVASGKVGRTKSGHYFAKKRVRTWTLRPRDANPGGVHRHKLSGRKLWCPSDALFYDEKRGHPPTDGDIPPSGPLLLWLSMVAKGCDQVRIWMDGKPLHLQNTLLLLVTEGGLPVTMSQEEMCSRLGCTEDRARAWLDILQERGRIIGRRQRGPYPNLYRLALPRELVAADWLQKADAWREQYERRRRAKSENRITMGSLA